MSEWASWMGHTGWYCDAAHSGQASTIQSGPQHEVTTVSSDIFQIYFFHFDNSTILLAVGFKSFVTPGQASITLPEQGRGIFGSGVDEGRAS